MKRRHFWLVSLFYNQVMRNTLTITLYRMQNITDIILIAMKQASKLTTRTLYLNKINLNGIETLAMEITLSKC